jgi:hypothetical protein
MILAGHSAEAKLAQPSAFKRTAYCILLSDPNQQRELKAALADLPGVSDVSIFGARAQG